MNVVRRVRELLRESQLLREEFFRCLDHDYCPDNARESWIVRRLQTIKADLDALERASEIS